MPSDVSVTRAYQPVAASDRVFATLVVRLIRPYDSRANRGRMTWRSVVRHGANRGRHTRSV